MSSAGALEPGRKVNQVWLYGERRTVMLRGKATGNWWVNRQSRKRGINVVVQRTQRTGMLSSRSHTTWRCVVIAGQR